MYSLQEISFSFLKQNMSNLIKKIYNRREKWWRQGKILDITYIISNSFSLMLVVYDTYHANFRLNECFWFYIGNPMSSVLSTQIQAASDELRCDVVSELAQNRVCNNIIRYK